MKINNLELPDLLYSDLINRRISLDQNERLAIESLFTRLESPLAELYNLEGMATANQLWTSAEAHHYLGTPSQIISPGDIDPRKALIIGHAEPDSPIVLDYRVTPPRVLYFGDFEHKTYWINLAPTYESFVARFRRR
jgi:hypothetical protein